MFLNQLNLRSVLWSHFSKKSTLSKPFLVFNVDSHILYICNNALQMKSQPLLKHTQLYKSGEI